MEDTIYKENEAVTLGLTACPYCGSKKLIYMPEHDAVDHITYEQWAKCTECGAEANASYKIVGTTWHKPRQIQWGWAT